MKNELSLINIKAEHWSQQLVCKSYAYAICSCWYLEQVRLKPWRCDFCFKNFNLQHALK